MVQSNIFIWIVDKAVQLFSLESYTGIYKLAYNCLGYPKTKS